MCGRYSLFTPQADLEARFDAAATRSFEPRYNCAPGQELPVIAGDDPDTIQFMEWGFVPSWADDRSQASINARSETAAEKPSFREAVERRRCLVLADGFYEWVQTEDGTRPYRVAFSDDRPFAMAGIWERWQPETAQAGLGDFAGGGESGTAPQPVDTFAILTTEPNDLVADLHHRMAVVLDADEEQAWLSGDAPVESVRDPHPAAELQAYPVSPRVNDPSVDAPELVEPVGEPLSS